MTYSVEETIRLRLEQLTQALRDGNLYIAKQQVEAAAQQELHKKELKDLAREHRARERELEKEYKEKLENGSESETSYRAKCLVLERKLAKKDIEVTEKKQELDRMIAKYDRTRRELREEVMAELAARDKNLLSYANTVAALENMVRDLKQKERAIKEEINNNRINAHRIIDLERQQLKVEIEKFKAEKAQYNSTVIPKELGETK